MTYEMLQFLEKMPMFGRYWVLDEANVPVPAKTMKEVFAFYETGRQVLLKTYPLDGMEISTIFLPTTGEFETMVFYHGQDTTDYLSKWDCLQLRYKTYEEAMAGHKEVSNRIFNPQ